MALDLSKVKDRESLIAQREPHWQRIRPGCFLGYRPAAREGLGTWIARAYDEDRRCYAFKALGAFGELAGRDRFVAAKKDAEAFAELIESGGRVVEMVQTVADACRRYAKLNTEAEGRFKRHVYSDAIARIKLAKLRRNHLKGWRDRLQAKPALVSRRKTGTPDTRPRAPATINREMAVLRAALNKILAPGAPDTEAAWQEALRPIRNANRQRTLYLDRSQRRALLAAIAAEAEPFVRSLCLLPLRPGAVANLTVANFDGRTSELSIGKDKSGKPRRILIPHAAAKLFAGQAKDKSLDAPLLARANGKPWSSDTWRKPISEAVIRANLPVGTTAYTLRHSTITDLVNGRLPLLTVAQISDTSVEMIERHYGHLDRHAAVGALARLVL